MQNNFQFTRNNYHPQIIACTGAGEEGLAGGREERGEGGSEGGRQRLPAEPGVSGRGEGNRDGGLPALDTEEGSVLCLLKTNTT